MRWQVVWVWRYKKNESTDSLNSEPNLEKLICYYIRFKITYCSDPIIRKWSLTFSKRAKFLSRNDSTCPFADGDNTVDCGFFTDRRESEQDTIIELQSEYPQTCVIILGMSNHLLPLLAFPSHPPKRIPAPQIQNPKSLSQPSQYYSPDRHTTFGYIIEKKNNRWAQSWQEPITRGHISQRKNQKARQLHQSQYWRLQPSAPKKAQ